MDEATYRRAREAFDSYAGIDAKDADTHQVQLFDLVALQIRLAAWQVENFGSGSQMHPALGISEELSESLEGYVALMIYAGRLSKTVLKHDQRIRNLADPDKARRAVADGLADLLVFAMQLCTRFRLDFGTLLESTGEYVMQRDWLADTATGGTGETDDLALTPAAIKEALAQGADEARALEQGAAR